MLTIPSKILHIPILFAMNLLTLSSIYCHYRVFIATIKYLLPLSSIYCHYRAFIATIQCRINHGANGAAAPGPPHRGGPPHQVLKNQFIWLTHCTYCSESNL